MRCMPPARARSARWRLALVLVLIPTFAGCGSGLAVMERALTKTLQTQTAATRSFTVWDAEHQAELVKRARTRQEAQQQLSAYRAQRVRLVELVRSSAAALDQLVAVLSAGGGPR